MKYLYIIDYWVPSQSSEYGGVVNVIASDDSEVFELLSKEEGFDETYIDRIMPNVIKAQKLQLAEDYDSNIIDAFIT